jgi:hypothetical protein
MIPMMGNGFGMVLGMGWMLLGWAALVALLVAFVVLLGRGQAGR